jgi:hypothetical protein
VRPSWLCGGLVLLVSVLLAAGAQAQVGAHGGTAPARLAVVVCPTALGISQPGHVRLPATVELAPAGAGGGLAAYTDVRGWMTVIAPRGWRCSADYGADGSGGVIAFPPGAGAASPRAIIGGETSACVGCTLGQACPLFRTAAAEQQSLYGLHCSTPRGETVVRLGPTVVAFADPPYVKGDGHPSGGPYPANGVMTYVGLRGRGSWIETCTLAPSQHHVCTVILDDFVRRYAAR